MEGGKDLLLLVWLGQRTLIFLKARPPTPVTKCIDVRGEFGWYESFYFLDGKTCEWRALTFSWCSESAGQSQYRKHPIPGKTVFVAVAYFIFRSVVEIAAFYVKLLSGDELSGFCFSCLGFLGLGEFSLWLEPCLPLAYYWSHLLGPGLVWVLWRIAWIICAFNCAKKVSSSFIIDPPRAFRFFETWVWPNRQLVLL